MLAMGSKPLGQLVKAGMVPKNLSLAKLRGKLYPAGDGMGHWMMTYDPYMVELDSQSEVDIQWDVRLALRYLMTGTLEPEVGRYRYVEDFTDVIALIGEGYKERGRRVHVTEDLETLGLWPWYDHSWIISIAFTVAPNQQSDVVVFPQLGDMPSKELLEQIEWIENTDKVSLGGANLKFDNVWKRFKWGLPSPENFKFDTLLGGGLLNENIFNSLSSQTKIYTSMGGYDDGFNQRHDKARMDLAYAKDPEGFLCYAGGDTDACARVRPRIAEQIRSDPNLLDFYTTILHPAARAFERIEYRGLFVNPEMLRTVGKECEVEAAEAIAAMNTITPLRVRRKWGLKFKYTPRILHDIFFGNHHGWRLTPKVLTESGKKAKKILEKQEGLRRDEMPISEYLATVPADQQYKKVSTSIDDHLKMFSKHEQAGAFLKELRTKNKAEKIQSSYVDGFLKHLRPDGRFHPSYGLYVGSVYEWAKGGDKDKAGANTGRTSAKNPHVQTIPKRGKWAKKLRACYPAPPGERFFNVDYSQGELKIGACLSDDPTMIQAHPEGQDLHLKTGARMAGISYEEAQKLETEDPDRYERIRYGAGSTAGTTPMFDMPTRI
jgi:hypothetical protein